MPPMLVRRLIVEPGEGTQLLALDEDGEVIVCYTPVDVVERVRKHDNEAARKGMSTATIIEWRDMPEGFTVPE